MVPTPPPPSAMRVPQVTLLRGPHRGVYYRLYVILDLFSRYVVGWLLAHHENGKLAARVLREACEREGIEQAQLTIHADRGTAATSNTVADMLAALGVRRSFQPPPRKRRQSLLGVPLQARQVLPDLPRSLCRPRRRQSLLQAFLRLVQRPPPSQRPRLLHPVCRPPRQHREARRRPRPRPRRRLLAPPRALRPRPAGTPHATRRRLHQPAPGAPRDHDRCSLN